jgi:hypothetical protein
MLAAFTVATAIGWVVDDCELLGVNFWEKQLKLAISGMI